MSKRAGTFTKEVAEMLELYKRTAEHVNKHQEDRPVGGIAKRSRDRLMRKAMGGSGTGRRNNARRSRSSA